MAYLEKLIKYDQAVLNPAGELEIIENGSRIRLRALDDLRLLHHFEKVSVGAQNLGAMPDAISGIALIGTNSGHQLSSSKKKFGNNSLLDNASNYSVSVSDLDEKIGTAPALTVDFWYRPMNGNTSGWIRGLVDRWYPGPCWRIYHINTDLAFNLNICLSGYLVLQTSGLNLAAFTWYHIRATFIDGDELNPGHAKIFLNGSEVAACDLNGTTQKFYGGPSTTYLRVLNHLDCWSGVPCHMDELRIFNAYLPDNFTPPSSATMPFSTNLPKAKLSLDAGVANALWILSDLAFLDETDFDSEGIKIRVDSDNDQTPVFSGDLLTLSQARMMGNLSGRYLHLEFSFSSDGDTQRTLYAGKAGLQSQRLALARQEPEIIARS
jgi:hypothetical protein